MDFDAQRCRLDDRATVTMVDVNARSDEVVVTRGGLAEARSNAERPASVLPARRWRTLFERAGYSDCRQ